MSAEYSVITAQDVPANSSVTFTASPVPCTRGLIYHRDGSGLFRLANRFFRMNILNGWRRNSNYQVSFHGNIQIPSDPAGTVETISLAIAVDGEVDPASIMEITPAAVGEPGNVGMDVTVTVPYLCGCSTVSVRNVSTQTITVNNAVIAFDE